MKKQELDLNKLSFEELQDKIKELEQQKEKATVKNIGIWQLGKNYVIRTVTMIQIGRLVEVTDNELVLEEASWIAETDRWYNFLKEGKIKECEPFVDTVIVGRHSLIDATEWKHKLPREQK